MVQNQHFVGGSLLHRVQKFCMLELAPPTTTGWINKQLVEYLEVIYMGLNQNSGFRQNDESRGRRPRLSI